jgi:hypothetical protein
MCRAAAAIIGVVTPSPGSGPSAGATGAAVAVARRVGEEAGRDQQERVHASLVRVIQDAARGREPSEGFDSPVPNLVWDFVGAIAGPAGRPSRTLAAVRDAERSRLLEKAPGPAEISIDAVAGAIRAQFSNTPSIHIDAEAAIVVTGALVMAVTVADDPDAAERGGISEVHPREVEIRAPWEMSHPILLSPAAWLIATAYRFT